MKPNSQQQAQNIKYLIGLSFAPNINEAQIKSIEHVLLQNKFHIKHFRFDDN